MLIILMYANHQRIVERRSAQWAEYACRVILANTSPQLSSVITLIIISILNIVMIATSQQSLSLHHHVYDADRPVAYRRLAILHRNCHHYHHNIIVIIIIEKIIIILYMLQTDLLQGSGGLLQWLRPFFAIHQSMSVGRPMVKIRSEQNKQSLRWKM